MDASSGHSVMNDKDALSIEQTRECMKVSMGAIKSKVLPLPNGEEFRMPAEAIPLMDEARRPLPEDENRRPRSIR